MFRFFVRIRLIVIDSPFIIDDSGFIKMSFSSPAIIVRAFTNCIEPLRITRQQIANEK